MVHHLVYIHGFNSSPLSWKARLTHESIRINQLPLQFHCPTLSHWPEEAMQTLTTLIDGLEGQITLIGSSLGGFYSTALLARYPDIRAVLVNPAVAPHQLLHQYLGKNKNMYSGEEYELTEQHMHQLMDLYLEQPKNSHQIRVLLQTGDETLDYTQAQHYYHHADTDIEQGGNHGYEGFENRLPEIYQFCGIQLPQPVRIPALNDNETKQT